MYKVFLKDSCFLLTDECNLHQPDTQKFVHKDFSDTKAFICHLLEQQEKFTVILYAEDLEALFSIFKSCFLYVKAAGGVVRKTNEILVIKRLGKYDLPKGHLEASETIEQCAIREVEEECGLQEVKIIAPLINTLHIYSRNENWYLKKTYWYTMTCPPDSQPSPQTEEDIEEVFWFPVGEIDSLGDLTYPSLIPVFQKSK